MSRSIEVSESTYSALEAAAAAAGTTPDRWLDVHMAEVLPAAGPIVNPEAVQPGDTVSGEDEPKSLLGLLMRLGGVGGFRSRRSGRAQRHGDLFIDEGELPPEVLADRFRALVKRAESLGGTLSERHGELFADGMEEKRRMGHL